jgi:hypothetical protein
VGYVAAWEDPRYWQAERIPSDGHWTEAGCATIAAIVTPALRAQLAGGAAGAGAAPEPAVARRAAP